LSGAGFFPSTVPPIGPGLPQSGEVVVLIAVAYFIDDGF